MIYQRRMKYLEDKRIVLTLDSGGTNFVFSAIRGNKSIIDPVILPAQTCVLEKSLETIELGFRQVMAKMDDLPVAISFAFPGPADYPNGIIDNVGNLPAFSGGVPLGPWLKDCFDLPVFIMNDGDLFTYGEAIAGFLPKVNKMFELAQSPKRFRHLFGITLGTGFGGGLVVNGSLYLGENACAGEIWLMRNKRFPESYAEEGVSIRAVKRSYARLAGIDYSLSPEPKIIYEIGIGQHQGDRDAARGAFSELGDTIGDALANATGLLDCLIVIGGGISHAYPLFIESILSGLNGKINNYDGSKRPRSVQRFFDLENGEDRQRFLKGEVKKVNIPGTQKSVSFDSLVRLGIGRATLNTSESIALGAYAYALQKLDESL